MYMFGIVYVHIVFTLVYVSGILLQINIEGLTIIPKGP